MKDVEYNGSLTKDLELINGDEKEKKESDRKTWIAWISLTVLDAIWMSLFSLHGHLAIGSLLIGFSTSSYIYYIGSLKRKEEERGYKKSAAITRVIEFAKNLSTDKKNAKDLQSSVTLDNLKDAIVITETKTIEKPSELIEQSNDGDIQDILEYVDVITSDIYYVDTNNRVRALREIKEIVTMGPKEEDNSLKIVSTQKLPIHQEIVLRAFEEDDYPVELPVKQVLTLKQD